MSSVIAVLSMLHQPAGRGGSATRLFRGSPVLGWTVRRLAASCGLSGVVVLCWTDQLAHVRQAAGRVDVICAGEREPRPLMEMVSAARRWSEGWRGGLLGTCCWDLGFDGPLVLRAMEQHAAGAVVLVDPDAALVDPVLVDQLIAHALERETLEFALMPAAPGLGGMLLREAPVRRYAERGGYPGRLLNYHPDLPGRDQQLNPECAPAPLPAARTLHRFVLDSQRQVDRLSAATASLNGELACSDALTLVRRMDAAPAIDRLPREIVLEINTSRATRAIFQPATHLAFGRGDMPLETAKLLLQQATGYEDTRLTLAGVGDPLLHPQFLQIVEAAREAGIAAIHVETDLAGAGADLAARLGESGVDVVSVHIPATSLATYRQVMGTEALGEVIAAIRTLLEARQKQSSLLPILVPLFAKCRENAGEMEAWYDYWLRTVGAAVITGPRDCAGQIPDASLVDMTPPRRVPCRRLASRLTVLSDGTVVACEEDVLGEMPMGNIHGDRLSDIWLRQLGPLRQAHADGACPKLCAGCRQWHRP